MASSSPAQPPNRLRYSDTMLTKVFVGGLAWEMPLEGLRRHFERYGDILEAVIIADHHTGRSKGFGFVTFREPEAAWRAVQDPTPVIGGRRANCNIALLGPPRPAQHRGRTPVGSYLQPVPPPAAQPPPFYPRPPTTHMVVAQQQHGSPGPIYPPQFGYWYPPGFQYQQQQALLDPQELQNYYAQLYGLTSPAPPPFHPYVGYMPPSPAPPTPMAFLPPPELAPQALVHHPAQPQIQGPLLLPPELPPQVLVHHPTPPPQIQGPFLLPMPSLPQNYGLQMPAPHAVPILPTITTGLQPPPPPSDQAAVPAARTTSPSTAPPGA